LITDYTVCVLLSFALFKVILQTAITYYGQSRILIDGSRLKHLRFRSVKLPPCLLGSRKREIPKLRSVADSLIREITHGITRNGSVINRWRRPVRNNVRKLLWREEDSLIKY
jgi:hypothetical protein